MILNNLLEFNQDNLIIDSAVTNLNLTSDIDALIFGQLILPNGITKVFQFVKTSINTFKAKLTLDEEDIPLLSDTYINLVIVNGELSQETNKEKLSFDSDKIRLSVKKFKSEEYKKLTIKLAELEHTLKAITNSYRLNSLELANQTSIKKGMIPVAIDDSGNFAAMYPFANTITSVNGQTTSDGTVKIDTTMIEYNKGSLEQYLKDVFNLIKLQQESIKALQEANSKMLNDIAELKISLETHLDNGVL